MAKLEEIEGIGPKYAATLRKAGVRSIGDLLQKGSTPEGRKTIAKDSGLSPKLILEWVNHSDLMRIKGVGEEYADLQITFGRHLPTIPLRRVLYARVAF